MKIHIKQLRAWTILGAYAHERNKPREVVINLSIDYDHSAAIESDKLADALDYALIEETIVDSLSKQRFTLLETLAEHVAQLVLGFVQAREVTVEIDKPGALKHAQSVAVSHTVRA